MLMGAWKIFVLGLLIHSGIGQAKHEDPSYSIFCNGRLLHDVQVHDLFQNQRDFLELRARISTEEISSKYRALRPKLKLSTPEGREALKAFVRMHFINQSSSKRIIPDDWSAEVPFHRKIVNRQTYDLQRILNRKWSTSYFSLTSEAMGDVMAHSTLPVRGSFFGSPSFNYDESWWVFQGLMVSGMIQSAKQLIENLAGLVDDYGYVPPENRVYFLGRSSPSWFPIILESYLNNTGDRDFARKLLPYAELDFLHWFQKSAKKVISAFDMFLIVEDPEVFTGIPRPERYKEDIMRTTAKNNSSNIIGDLDVRALIWDSDPPRETLSVRLTSVTEWSARALARLCNEFASTRQKEIYSFISWELLHTLDALLYSRKNGQWMDYSSKEGHVNNVSLWPVYTGARSWQNHYKLANEENLEDITVAVTIIEGIGNIEAARELIKKGLEKVAKSPNIDLKSNSMGIILLQMHPEVKISVDSIASPVHSRIVFIGVPMMFATLVCIPFLFTSVKING